jgi:hypothetical protein
MSLAPVQSAHVLTTPLWSLFHVDPEGQPVDLTATHIVTISSAEQTRIYLLARLTNVSDRIAKSMGIKKRNNPYDLFHLQSQSRTVYRSYISSMPGLLSR